MNIFRKQIKLQRSYFGARIHSTLIICLQVDRVFLILLFHRYAPFYIYFCSFLRSHWHRGAFSTAAAFRIRAFHDALRQNRERIALPKLHLRPK